MDSGWRGTLEKVGNVPHDTQNVAFMAHCRSLAPKRWPMLLLKTKQFRGGYDSRKYKEGNPGLPLKHLSRVHVQQAVAAAPRPASAMNRGDQ